MRDGEVKWRMEKEAIKRGKWKRMKIEDGEEG